MNFSHSNTLAEQAFETFAPNRLQGALLDAAAALHPARKGAAAALPRFLASALRKAALFGRSEPLDRLAPWGHNVRLYGHDNTTDKYLMYAITPVDDGELAAMRAVAEAASRPVHVLDIGGNSGLYTLQAWAALQAADLEIASWLCVEPNPMMRDRLADNLALNGLDRVTMVDCALSDGEGEIEMETDFANLGKVRIPLDGGRARKPISVPMTTLAKLLTTFGQGTPDIVKVDIEGHEQVMFEAFWRDAPDVRPPLIILEMWPGKEGEQTACMARGGYNFVSKPSENAIFIHESAPDIPGLKN
ncbi:MAG: FkbM family methyltransferase [Pseudomonadota bacterium]